MNNLSISAPKRTLYIFIFILLSVFIYMVYSEGVAAVIGGAPVILFFFYYFIYKLNKSLLLTDRNLEITYNLNNKKISYNIEEIAEVHFTASESIYNTKEIVVFTKNSKFRYEHIFATDETIVLINKLLKMKINTSLSEYYKRHM